MRLPILTSTICILALLGACQKKAEPEQSADSESASASPAEQAAAPGVATSPPPQGGGSTAAAAASEPRRLAPDGEYYLTTSVSISTDDGIFALRPGTKALKQPDGKFLSDGHTVELRPDQITNDLRVAAQAMGADRAAQAGIQRSLQARAAAERAVQQRSTATPKPAAVQSTAATPYYRPGVTTGSSALQSSTALGAGHTRTGEGHLWQKSADGKEWVPIKRLDGKPMGYPTPRFKPVR
jgi:hypothetical protein